MQLNSVSSANLYWSSPVSSPLPTTCSTKFLKEPGRAHPAPSFLTVRCSKRNAQLLRPGLQKPINKTLSNILRTEAAIKAIEQKANSNKHTTLWPKAVLDALDEAISSLNWEAALKIFGLLRKQQWYEPRSQIYSKLMMMLGKCGQAEQANLLFDVMRCDGMKPTIDVYTALVSAYAHSGRFEEAFSIIDEMKSVPSDCNPDVYTYSILLNSCTKLGRFDLIRRILDEMSYLGIEGSTVTFNTIVDGYGKAGMFVEMENSLAEMVENGSSVPDIFTLNSVIGAYGRSGQIEKMEKWYDEFQLMGVSPDIKTFNIMIRSYGRVKMHKKMKSVLKFMKKRFFSPTIMTHNIILDAYGKSGDIYEMGQYFKNMKHQGLKPNTVTYCSLVSAYSKAGDMMKVDSILRHVENSDVIPDTALFNCLISAYGRAGELDKMEELFKTMAEKNYKPDYVTYATMIQAYNAQGMTEPVKDLEKKMLAVQNGSGMCDDVYQIELCFVLGQSLS
ncbi:Pentatricopeptide repeat-containing protein At3g53170 [Linum perenne]